jgi:hypothetical protein
MCGSNPHQVSGLDTGTVAAAPPQAAPSQTEEAALGHTEEEEAALGRIAKWSDVKPNHKMV